MMLTSIGSSPRACCRSRMTAGITVKPASIRIFVHFRSFCFSCACWLLLTAFMPRILGAFLPQGMVTGVLEGVVGAVPDGVHHCPTKQYETKQHKSNQHEQGNESRGYGRVQGPSSQFISRSPSKPRSTSSIPRAKM